MGSTTQSAVSFPLEIRNSRPVCTLGENFNFSHSSPLSYVKSVRCELQPEPTGIQVLPRDLVIYYKIFREARPCCATAAGQIYLEK